MTVWTTVVVVVEAVVSAEVTSPVDAGGRSPPRKGSVTPLHRRLSQSSAQAN